MNRAVDFLRLSFEFGLRDREMPILWRWRWVAPVLMAGMIFGWLNPQLALAADFDGSELQALYTFDEGWPSGEEHGTVFDQSEERNAGTLYGASFLPVSEGFVLSFDGRASFAKCARPNRLLFGQDPFSVEFWIKRNSLKAGIVMGKKGSEPDDAGWLIEIGESGQGLKVTLADGLRHDSLSVPLEDPENWHHVSLVRDGTSLMAYVDGLKVASGETFGGDVSNGTVFLHLGKIIGPQRSFHGELDDVRIWHRALDPGEIKETFQKDREMKTLTLLPTPASPEETLLIHYRFDTDPMDTAKDLSGNGHDGIIHDGNYLQAKEGQPGALHFNGESAYIEIPAAESLGIKGDMTFEMWVRQYGPPKTKGAVIFGEVSPGSNYLFSLAYGYNLLFSYRNGSSYGMESVSLPVTNTLLSPEWAHIAVVVEYPRCRFYRNGELVRDQFMPIPGLDAMSKRSLRLGGEPKNDYFAPLDLREFRLHRRALAAEEIAAHAKGETFSGAMAGTVAVEPDWYKEVLGIRYTHPSGGKAGQKMKIRLLMEGKEFGTRTVALTDESGNQSGRFTAQADFPLEGLEGKNVEARVEGGKDVPVSRSLLLKKPAWIHAQQAYSGRVPAPWTPVKMEVHSKQSLDVEVWGRRYEFDGSLLPTRIIAADASLLAEPIQLSAEIEGKAVAWQRGPIEVVESSPEKLKMEQKWKRGGVQLAIEASLEFDGFLHYRCVLTSDQNIQIDRLTVNIPFQKKHAAFCYADRAYPLVDGDYVATFQSGAIDGPLGFQFSPNVWIGDDDRGLTWQAESDQWWNPADPLKFLEVLPGESQTDFRANLIAKASAVGPGKEWVYEFALLATPMRPLTKDAWSWRIARYEPWGTDFDLPNRKVDGRPELEVIHDVGVRHLYSYITDAYAWPMPQHEAFAKGLRGLVAAAHDAGVKVHPYVVHQRIAVEVPEFDLYGTQMANRPMKGYSHAINFPRNLQRPTTVALDYGADSSSTVFMCAKSEALRDAFIHSVDERLEEFGEDGVYLDGTVHIGPLCFNEAHGCGYRDEEGGLHGTYGTFGTRKLMQGLYEVVKSHRPDGIVDVHSSYGFNPSGLAYTDVMWTGEQWHHLRKTGTDYVSEELTLDKFRTEFTGRQLGIGAETLHYRLRHPMKIAATSLLHDISPRYSTGGYDNATQSKNSYFELMPKIWRMRDAFGIEDAERLWYWENQNYVTVSGEQNHATLFKHPKNGVLAFVSNLSRNRDDVEVIFNWTELGWKPGELHPVNALTGEPLEMNPKGGLTIPLGSEEWIYVWLKPADQTVHPTTDDETKEESKNEN